MTVPAFAQKYFPTETWPVNGVSYTVRLADFNNDGRLDLYTTNGTPASTLQVCLADAFGGYQSPIQTFLGDGASPFDFEVADLSGDGITDVVWPNNTLDTVGIRKGTGALGFHGTAYLPSGIDPFAVAAGFIDNDGFTDLAVACYGDINIKLYFGTGGGNFGPAQNLTVGTQVYALELQDVSGDGKADLIVCLQSLDFVYVFPGTGTQMFQAPSVYPMPAAYYPRDVAIGDLTGDSAPDLAIVLAHPDDTLPGKIQILINNGSGLFSYGQEHATGVRPWTGAIRDVTNDSNADILVNNYGDGTMSLYYGSGTGTITKTEQYPINKSTSQFGIADLDMDGDQDVVVGAESGSNGQAYVTILRGRNPGPFDARPIIPAGKIPRAVCTADFTGDGLTDIAAANGVETGGTINIILETAPDTFAAPTSVSIGGYPFEIVSCDFNKDGNVDLCVSRYTSPTIALLEGDGAGGFLHLGDLATAPGTRTIKAVDFNNDGWADLAAAGAGVLRIHHGGPAGFFGGPVTNVVYTGEARALESFDLNQNGTVDFVFTKNSTIMNVVLSDGLGGFSAPVNYTCPNSPFDISINDLNQDGRVDCVIGNMGGGAAIGIYTNLGAGIFSAMSPLFAGLSSQGIETADVTGDGWTDLVCARFFGTSITVVPGTSGGGFNTSAFKNHAASIPLDVVVADLNYDGRPDLLSTSSVDAGLTYLPGQVPNALGIANFGVGSYGCAGKLATNTRGRASIGSTSFRLSTTNVPPLSIGFYMIGDVSSVLGADFFGLGLLLHVDLILSTELLSYDVYSDHSGVSSIGVPVPNNPSLVGLQFCAQSVWIEPSTAVCGSGLYGLISSNGLAITVTN